MQLGLEIWRERVHPLRTIEGNGRDALLDAVDQIFVASSMSLGFGVGFHFDRNIDRGDAFTGSANNDGIEIECAKRAGLCHGEVAEPHQQRGQRFDVAAWPAARAK